jgi:hypothetical protein
VRHVPWLIVAIELAAVQIGCAPKGESDAVHVVSARENGKYGLICQFHGRHLPLENGKSEMIVEYVSVKDRRTGEEVRFSPTDAATLVESSGFFEQVWSPGEETIVLPLGRYDGFWITRSSQVLQRLARGGSDDSIRVQLRSGTRLWHQFSRWKGPSCIVFEAGLSGQQTTFTYSVLDKTVTTNGKISGDFIAVNSGGELKIAEDDGSLSRGKCEGSAR